MVLLLLLLLFAQDDMKAYTGGEHGRRRSLSLALKPPRVGKTIQTFTATRRTAKEGKQNRGVGA